MKIRESTLEDLKNIATLHAESWRQNYSEVLSKEYLENNILDERVDLWRQRLISPKGNQLVLIAEIDKEFCGFICSFGGNHSEYGTVVDNLHIKSEMKGNGIGSKLLASVAEWAEENYSEDCVYLEVLACNPKAIAFYEHLGAEKQKLAYWQTPCGNKAKEYIYSWRTPKYMLSHTNRK